jgi:hypothetical protein
MEVEYLIVYFLHDYLVEACHRSIQIGFAMSKMAVRLQVLKRDGFRYFIVLLVQVVY